MKSSLRILLLLLTTLLLSGCFPGSPDGSNDPSVSSGSNSLTAVPKAIGLDTADSYSTSNIAYIARANSVVTLSAKDSDGPNPILSFSWRQVDDTAPQVDLFERTANSKAFVSPDVEDPVTLTFELTVEDSQGGKDVSTLSIEIQPVSDADRFLISPETPQHKLELIAAVTGGESTGTEPHQADIEATFIAYWLDRNGEQQSKTISTQIQQLTFPAGFSPEEGYDPLAHAENPRISFELDWLDLDQINVDFEDEDSRDKRLDPWRIGDATIEIELSLTTSSSLSFEVSALSPEGEILPASQLNSNFSPAAFGIASVKNYLLKSNTSEISTSIQQDNLLSEMGLESNISARNYYALIDPEGRFAKFDAWLEYAGFPPIEADVSNRPDIAHAIYLNNYDLGFGRDMYLRKDDQGNVYSYVVNYPSVEAAINKTGEFALVVMEYSDNPDPEGENAKIVKFYSYVPDTINGGYVRTTTMNFDGRGEKPVPGVCTACHQSDFGDRQFTHVSEADIDATFMPWDLDSFLYVAAEDEQYVESTIDASKYAASDSISLDEYSRENQEEALRQLNLGALATYKDNPQRHQDSIALIHGWYGDEAMTHAIDSLPDNTFDGNYVQPGWQDQSELYHTVFARNCRLCHVQIGNDDKDFDTYEEFVENGRLINYVYEIGAMPMARLTMDRFWAFTYDGDDTASTLLRDHLLNAGEAVSERPGLPAPKFELLPDITIDDQVTLDASASLFTEQFSWQLLKPDSSSSTLANTDMAQTSFQPDVPGGEYQIILTATGESGKTAELSRTLTVVDRAPEAECFDADTNGLTALGELDDIAVLSQIFSLGDGNIRIASLEAGTYGTAEVTEDGQGIHYRLNNPFLRGVDAIRYRLEDVNGTLSDSGTSCETEDGYGEVRIDSRRGELSPTSVDAVIDETLSSSTINLSWLAPSDIDVEAYHVYREDQATPLAQTTDLAFTDTNLRYGTQYRYYITSVIGEFESESSAWASATTAQLEPSNVTASAGSTSSIDLTWRAPEIEVQTYRVYEVDSTSGNSLLSATSDTSFSVEGLEAGTTYTLGVSAEDSSQESDVSTASATSTYPNTPESLNAVLGADARSQSIVTWQAPGSGNWDGYTLQRKSASGSYSTLTQPIEEATQYVDSGLSPDMQYNYRIAANASGLTSIYSTEVSVTTLASDAGKPTGLTAGPHPENDATQISLSWNLPESFSPAELRLYRDQGADGSYETNVTLDAALTTYIDDALSPNTIYQYYIASYYDGSGATDPSDAVSTSTLALTPTDLVTTNQTETSISFEWAAPNANVEGYQIMRDGEEIVSSQSSTTYSDSALAAGQAYTYEVRALQNSQYRAVSASLATLPSAPSNLLAENVAGVDASSALSLSWSYEGADPEAWILERREGSELNFSEVTGPDASLRTYTDTGLNPDTTYEYRLAAQKNALVSDSVISNSVDTEPVSEEAPQNLSVTADNTHDATQINLSWSINSGFSPSSYRIIRDDTLIAQDITGTSYSDDNQGTWLEPGTTYSYRVLAVYPEGEASSATSQGSTQSLEVQNFAASAQTTDSMTLGWQAPDASVSHYQVLRDGQSISDSQASTDYADSGLQLATVYEYEIRAVQNGKYQSSTLSLATTPNTPISSGSPSVTTRTSQFNWTISGEVDSWLITRDGEDMEYTASELWDGNRYSFNEDNLTAGTEYTYLVRAIANNTQSSALEVDVATLPFFPFAEGTNVVTDTTATFSWTHSGNVDTWVITLDGVEETYSAASLVDGSKYTFNDTGLTPGTQYSYSVQAEANGARSASLDLDILTQLATPTEDSKSSTTTTTDISWDYSNSFDNWVITRNDGASDVAINVNLVTVSGNTYSLNDTGLTAGTAYTYSIQAQTTDATSEALEIEVATLPQTPTAGSFNSVSTSSVEFNWTHSGNLDSWQITRNDGTSDVNISSGSVSVSGSTYTLNDTGLDSDKTYTYSIRAEANSEVSTAIQMKRLETPVAGATSSTTSTTQVNWSYSGDLSSWNITRNGGGISGTVSGSYTLNESTGLSAGTEYTYNIQAQSSNGLSAAIDIDVATVPNAPSASATATSPTTIQLTWSASCSDTATFYVDAVSYGTSAGTNIGSLNNDQFYDYDITVSCNGETSAATQVSATTLVSYSNQIFGLIDAASGGSDCSGCHADSEAAIYSRLSGAKNSTCIVNETLSTCDALMNSITDFDNPASLLWKWFDQGALNN